jgi:hypothetical protein
MESPFRNDESAFASLDDEPSPATDRPGKSTRTTEPESGNQIHVEASKEAIHINIESTNRPIEIRFSDGTKIVHAAGSKVIIINRGPQFKVTGCYNKRTS